MKYLSQFLSVAALFAVAGTAQAADLGGNCCADLEERVAELEATTARKGNRKVSLTIYGQVNQAVMYWDDSTEDNVYVVNNKSSTTLVGLEGKAAINATLSAGYRVEFEVPAANSDFVDQGTVPGFAGVGTNTGQRLNARHSYWWLEDKHLGRVSVGLQSNATDGVAEVDLSRTSAISGSAVEAWNEGFFLRDKNTGLGILQPNIITASGGPAISTVGELYRGNFDGGRGNLVRYDTPVIAGAIASVTWGEDDDFAAAVRYAATHGEFKVAAAFGYHRGAIVDTDNVVGYLGAIAYPDHEDYVGSASLLHVPTGIFLTGAAGKRNWIDTAGTSELRGEDYFYLKSGLVRKWFALGETTIYGEYYHISNVGFTAVAALDESATSYGLGAVQQVDGAAMEFYAAWRHYTADDITDVFLNDHSIKMDIVMSGARIKF